MKPWHSIAAIALAVALTIGIMLSIQPTGPSTRELQQQAKATYWQARADAAYQTSAHYRREAMAKDEQLTELKLKLKNNKITTHEKVTAIDSLPADSLGGYIADQLHFLDRAWY
jgi:non-ribosomal peptide synthetase component F